VLLDQRQVRRVGVDRHDFFVAGRGEAVRTEPLWFERGDAFPAGTEVAMSPAMAARSPKPVAVDVIALYRNVSHGWPEIRRRRDWPSAVNQRLEPLGT
jgi:hypothetical protein